MRRVVVLGASNKPERTAYEALSRLIEAGFDPIPVNPALDTILGRKCYPALADVARPVETLTVYLGEKRSTPLIDEILALKPGRIILNPGAENDVLATKAKGAGIPVENACTLVLLGTGQF